MNKKMNKQPKKPKTTKLNSIVIIVFIWSQLDGGKVNKEQWHKFPPKPYIQDIIILHNL